MVGGLFGGAGEEGGDGSDEEGVAAEKGVGCEGSEGGEEKREGEAEKDVVELVFAHPWISLLHFHSSPCISFFYNKIMIMI